MRLLLQLLRHILLLMLQPWVIHGTIVFTACLKGNNFHKSMTFGISKLIICLFSISLNHFWESHKILLNSHSCLSFGSLLPWYFPLSWHSQKQLSCLMPWVFLYSHSLVCSGNVLQQNWYLLKYYWIVILALSLFILSLFYFNYSLWNNASWIIPWHSRVITSFANKIFSKRQNSLLIYYFEVFFVLKITIVRHVFSYLKSHKILLNSQSCTNC